MTVFDPSTLHRLVDDADGRCFLLDLARTYQRMLTPRVDRLVAGVRHADTDDAMDAALSLKVSSTMTGASELAELASFIEADLRRHDLPAARARAFQLTAAALRAHDAIEEYLASRPSAQLSADSMR